MKEVISLMELCLLVGIIRKTRTVMECLHRFCRECIDKSMRLGYFCALRAEQFLRHDFFALQYIALNVPLPRSLVEVMIDLMSS